MEIKIPQTNGKELVFSILPPNFAIGYKGFYDNKSKVVTITWRLKKKTEVITLNSLNRPSVLESDYTEVTRYGALNFVGAGVEDGKSIVTVQKEVS